jgi:hypothetical protein
VSAHLILPLSSGSPPPAHRKHEHFYLLIYCPCFQMVIKLFVMCAVPRVGNFLTRIISFPRKWGQFPGHSIAISVKYLDRICHKTEIVRTDIFHLTSQNGIRIGGWSLLDLLATVHWLSRNDTVWSYGLVMTL